MKKLFLIIFILGFVGCASNNSQLETMPPEKLYDLLHRDCDYYARKSITIEDYTINEEC